VPPHPGGTRVDVAGGPPWAGGHTPGHTELSGRALPGQPRERGGPHERAAHRHPAGGAGRAGAGHGSRGGVDPPPSRPNRGGDQRRRCARRCRRPPITLPFRCQRITPPVGEWRGRQTMLGTRRTRFCQYRVRCSGHRARQRPSSGSRNPTPSVGWASSRPDRLPRLPSRVGRGRRQPAEEPHGLETLPGSMPVRTDNKDCSRTFARVPGRLRRVCLIGRRWDGYPVHNSGR
jgi:hypothetical protein